MPNSTRSAPSVASVRCSICSQKCANMTGLAAHMTWRHKDEGQPTGPFSFADVTPSLRGTVDGATGVDAMDVEAEPPFRDVFAAFNNDTSHAGHHNDGYRDPTSYELPDQHFVEPHPVLCMPLKPCTTAFAEMRAKQLAAGKDPWAPFEDMGQWELAEWAMKSGMTQAALDAFLRLSKVRRSSLLLVRLINFLTDI